MFGYILPLKSELKVREFNYFKSYYHGLCYNLKSNFGNISRLTLNYDMTFLGFLLDGLNQNCVTLEKKRCIKHPVNEIIVVSQTKALDYMSNLTILFSKYKLKDNIVDDNDFKSKVYYLFLNPPSKKIKSKYESTINLIKKNLDDLSELENNHNETTSLDDFCHPFSDCIGSILKNYDGEIFDDNLKTRNNLYNLGYNLGKYIYLIDAFDDLKDDLDKNAFNPINISLNKNNYIYSNLLDNNIEDIEFLILNTIYSALESFNKIDFKKHKDILDNILNLGLVQKYYEIKQKNLNEKLK